MDKNLNLYIGKRIAGLRKESKMTQETLSEKLDISIKHCSSVERGVSSLSLEKLIEVCELFDISLDYLIRDKQNTIEYNQLPSTITDILNSKDESEISLLKEYLHLYSKLRRNK